MCVSTRYVCLLYLQAREQPLTASQTIRTGATLQAKVTKSLLDSPHDELMENNNVKLPTVAMQLGNEGVIGRHVYLPKHSSGYRQMVGLLSV